MSQLEARAAAKLAPGRSISVKAKLRNAFIGIAAFSLLAAVAGVVSHQTVDLAQQDIIERALPVARHVGELVDQGTAAIDITAALIAATHEGEVSEQRSRIEEIEKRWQVELDQWRSIDSKSEQSSRFEYTLGEIFEVLHKQTALVTQRNRLLGQRNDIAAHAVESSARIAETLRPEIIEATARTFAETDRIRAKLQDPSAENRDIANQFDSLMSKDVQRMQLLTSMRDQTVNLIYDIEALLLTQTTVSLAEYRDKLNIHLRSLGRMTIEMRDRSFQRTIGAHLRQISQAIRGSDNILSLQGAYLETIGQIEALSVQNRELRSKFSILASGLQQTVDETIEASTARAERALWYGRISLIAIAILALLSAIWVIWRYVWTDVAARLDRVATITRRLAGGDLGVDIDIKGKDELGDVADAMRLFKTNAIELQRSNADLEQFAYVASHDLKAPLRGIANLATWIEEDIGDVMNEDTKKHIGLLKNRIDRLSALLEDLLQYSRAGREENEIRWIDLDNEIPELFRLVAANDRFELELEGKMPAFDTAAVPIEQIFRNLFENAIKHHDQDRGTITVRCLDRRNRFEFIVEDDGPGIAPEYHERVFGMFQTIRSRDQVEGSGIGLSVGKKLVESVDCRMWVVSNPNVRRGAAIHFTWPVDWPNSLILKKSA